jgi:YgiT-type zinc finger domain-containing protein
MEIEMFKCDVCGSTEAREALVTEVFEIDGRRVLVENIPALVCSHCGESVFNRETTEKVRRMLHGEAEPVGTVQLDVFSYA